MASSRGRGRGRKLKVSDARAGVVLTPPEYSSRYSQELPHSSCRSPDTSPRSDHEEVITLAERGSRWNKDGSEVDSGSEGAGMHMEGERSVFAGSDCVVCGDKASGQYFGAMVCLPCKSFYIRCTKDGEPFFSTRCLGNCDVTKQARIRCQSCRYQKCLEAGMSRKEKPERVDPEEGQYLCLVCGDIANGIHFGVFTCEGCKKFFRRGLVENKSYNCKGDNSCVINPRSRNNCRACRYQKCVEVGMSREAIKMGRPKKKDTDLSRREKTTPPKLPLPTDDSLDVILVHSNDSESDEDTTLFDRPASASTDHSKHATTVNRISSPTGDSQLPCYKAQSPVTESSSVKRMSGKSWSSFTLQKVTSEAGVSKTFTTVSSQSSPLSLSSTLTSGSEYSSYEGHRQSPDCRDSRQTSVLDMDNVQDAGRSTSNDLSSIYSMSSEDIDSMLQLLEDFERPKPFLTSRRRRSRDETDECGEKRRRLSDESESMDAEARSISHYERSLRPSGCNSPQERESHSVWGSPDDKPQQLSVEEDHNRLKESACHPQYVSPREAAQHKPGNQPSVVDTYMSHDEGLQVPEPHSHPLMNESDNDECSCQCWGRQPKSSSRWIEPEEPSAHGRTLKECSITSSNVKAYNMKVLEQHTDSTSLSEISRAFGVLYDKFGYSSVMEDGYSGDRRKQSIASVESWWDIDVNCRCIQITGGLCLCRDTTLPGEYGRSEDMFLASVPSPITRICTTLVREPRTPYMSRKYRGQMVDIADPISGVQQHLLHQLVETCLMRITGESGEKEKIAAPEITSLLRT